jgi:hypothetical protein
MLWITAGAMVNHKKHVKGLKADSQHTVKATFWSGSGYMRMKVTYSGPDTRGRERLLGATVSWAPPRVLKSIWYVCRLAAHGVPELSSAL